MKQKLMADMMDLDTNYAQKIEARVVTSTSYLLLNSR